MRHSENLLKIIDLGGIRFCLSLVLLIFLFLIGCGARFNNSFSTASTPSCNSSGTPFGGGSGTASDPYLVCSPTQLDAVRNYLNASFKQMSSIDLKDTTFLPIGSSTNPFTGTYNGNGKKISNWTYSDSTTSTQNYIGFFSYIADPVNISNMNLVNVNVLGNTYVGGLIGYYCGSGANAISGNSTTGKVEGTVNNTGGLIGYICGGTLQNNYSTANVTGWAAVGGLIGYVAGNLTLTNNYASGAVVSTRSTGNNYAGGLVGYINKSVSISNSYATASVTASGLGYVGGLIGYIGPDATSTQITSCFANGDVSVPLGSYVGGLIGLMYNTTLQKSYATGNISSLNMAGGLVGKVNPTSMVSDSYASGSVSTTQNTGNCYTGGLIGYGDTITVNNSNAKGAVNGAASIVGGLLGAITDASSIVSNSFSTGSVNSPSDSVGGLVGSVASGTVSSSYSTSAVSGGTSVGGLVGRTATGVVIQKSYATGSVSTSSTATSASVGGAVGLLSGASLSQSYATGNVSASDTAQLLGGLVGRSISGATITNCYATGSVSGATATRLGGLVGQLANATSTVTNSYSSGAVSGAGTLGGLIAQCTSCGSVTDSFWDQNTSGQASSAGGTQKTTPQMQTQSTFTNWDFSSVWQMLGANTYPTLR